MTPEQFEKLPKWAQEEFNSIKRQRDTVVEHIKDFCDESTPSSIWIDELVCDGESRGPTARRRYIQSRLIRINFGGVYLQILLREPGSGNGQKPVIDLQWTQGESLNGDVIFQPRSFQAAYLFAPDFAENRRAKP